ncbi:MAG: FtsX-like permease family protein [Tissierellia bacterium]|nr:FtsX-like permease family protein [Tissierellia bacterium]
MQKLLFKRIFRDRKNNFRYFSLFILILISMSMMLSVMGAALSVISTVDNNSIEKNLEDGCFSLFIPMTEKEKARLENMGLSIQENFYLDYLMEDGSFVRCYKNRKDINQINISEGDMATDYGELCLEQNYAKAKNIKLGSDILIGDIEFKVKGFCSSPDYDAALKELNDSAVNSNNFGTAFMNEDSYNRLLESGKADRSEEYSYSYLLNNSMTDIELKDELKKIKIDIDDVEDEYFQLMMKEKEEDKNELLDKTDELREGGFELTDGIFSLNYASDELRNGLDSIEALLKKNRADQFAEANKEYLDSVKELSEGAVKFRSGLYRYTEKIKELSDEIFPTEIENLLAFVPKDYNQRIGASINDVEIELKSVSFSGVIILILLTYVISVFVVHSIEEENNIIGTMLALGVSRKNIMFSYTLLPMLITFMGGALGILVSMSKIGIEYQLKEKIDYYSMPPIDINIPTFLFIYALVLPPLVAYIVNKLVIRKKINRPALALLRNEQKIRKVKESNFGNRFGFIRKFQFKQFWKEKRSGFAVLIGLFMSLVILLVALNTYVFCAKMRDLSIQDTKFKYMYSYKYPTKELPKGGFEAYTENLKKKIMGYNLDISIIGIGDDNPFFPKIKSEKQNEISISTSIASKFKLKKGDKIVLSDDLNDINYGFTIVEIVPYSVGLTAFMDIDSMRELFDRDDDYYNTLFSDKKLDIDSGRLYNITTDEEIEETSNVFIIQMMEFIYTLISTSILITIIVMYQMMKVMIDRSSHNVSLFKIFGYKNKEIRKLYMDGNFYLICLGSIITIPLAKIVVDAVYPYFVSDVAWSTGYDYPFKYYIILFLGIMLNYIIVRTLLMRKVNSITPAEVLKNRE